MHLGLLPLPCRAFTANLGGMNEAGRFISGDVRRYLIFPASRILHGGSAKKTLQIAHHLHSLLSLRSGPAPCLSLPPFYLPTLAFPFRFLPSLPPAGSPWSRTKSRLVVRVPLLSWAFGGICAEVNTPGPLSASSASPTPTAARPRYLLFWFTSSHCCATPK